MKIVLPVHSCTDAKLIIDFVTNFHWPPYACFRIIHVVEDHAGYKPTAEQKDADDKHRMSIISYMRSRLTTLLPAALAEYKLLSGDPAQQIIQTATDWQADMIVMGSRTGIHGDWTVTGSVSRAVVVDAPCSVVTIRPPARTATANMAARSLDLLTTLHRN